MTLIFLSLDTSNKHMLDCEMFVAEGGDVAATPFGHKRFAF
jgi:hypothetical protein